MWFCKQPNLSNTCSKSKIKEKEQCQTVFIVKLKKVLAHWVSALKTCPKSVTKFEIKL